MMESKQEEHDTFGPRFGGGGVASAPHPTPIPPREYNNMFFILKHDNQVNHFLSISPILDE